MKELNILNHGREPPSSRRDLVNWVKARLKRYNIKLRKRLSQVILVDPRTLLFMARKLNEFIVDKDTVTILEIGAGIGNLTQFISYENKSALIIAVEIDYRFAPILQEIKGVYSNVDIIIGDAVDLLKTMRGIDIVIGNIPYHITSDILLALAQSDISFALLTVQKDVAERIASKPGTKTYGKLSILMQILFEINMVKVLPAKLFIPNPQVSSAIVILKRRRKYDTYIENIEKLTKCLFSYKRKLVSKALEYCLGEELGMKLEMEGEIWRKRVFHLTVEDIMKLASIYVELKKKS